MSSGPHRDPDIGGRSKEEAFLSVGGAMLFILRPPWIRPCPWQGGGSGGGGRSVPRENHTKSTEYMSYVYITITPFFKFKLSKCVASSLTVCTSISPMGCCALTSGFASWPSGPLVAQAVCADCAAICWKWTAGPRPMGQAFTCRRDKGPRARWLVKILRSQRWSQNSHQEKEKLSIKIQQA